MDDKVKCKYLGEHSGDCWLCSGNIFQMCMYSNKKECLLLKNEQRKDKINELEQQNLALKEENEKLQFINDRLNNALGARRAGKNTFIELAAENTTLKQKLKLAVEALENIKNAPQNKCATKNLCSDCLKIPNKDFKCEYITANEALTKIGEIK